MTKQPILDLTCHILDTVYPDEYEQPQIRDFDDPGNSAEILADAKIADGCYDVKTHTIYLHNDSIDLQAAKKPLINYPTEPNNTLSRGEQHYQLSMIADFYNIEPEQVTRSHKDLITALHEAGHAIGMNHLLQSTEEQQNHYLRATRPVYSPATGPTLMDYTINLDEQVAEHNGKWLLTQLLNTAPELVAGLPHGYTPEILAQSTLTPIEIELSAYEMWHIEKPLTELTHEIPDSRQIRSDILQESQPIAELQYLLENPNQVIETACQLLSTNESEAFAQLCQYGLHGVDQPLHEHAARVGTFLNETARQNMEHPHYLLSELAVEQQLNGLLSPDNDTRTYLLTNFHERHPTLTRRDPWPPTSSDSKKPWLADGAAPDAWYRFYSSAIDGQLCVEQRNQSTDQTQEHLLYRIGPMSAEKNPEHLYQLSEQQPLAEVLETAHEWWKEGPNYDPKMNFPVLANSLPDAPDDSFQDLTW